MLTKNTFERKFTLSILSTILICSFPSLLNQANGATIPLTDNNTYSQIKANTNDIGSGNNITVSSSVGSSNDGAVSALDGGNITLSNSNISNVWNSTAGSRAVNARGTNSVVTLNNTNAQLSATQASNGDASSVVSATSNGNVFITGGTFAAAGAYVRGLSAAGDNPDNGGGYIRAENATITTLGNFGLGVQAYGSNNPLMPVTQVDLIGGSVTTNSTNYAPALQSARIGALITTQNTNLTANGANNLVVDVNRGGGVNIAGGNIVANGATSAGISADGSGSHAVVNGSNIIMNGEKSVGVSASNGGIADISNNSIALTDIGTNGMGAYASGSASGINLINTVINVKGAGTNGGNAPIGVGSENGGTVTLTGGSVTMDGANRTIAARVVNNGTLTATGTLFATKGNNSHAVMSWLNDPVATGIITLNNATITTAGTNAYGLTANNSANAQITANNTNITTTGDIGRGVYAWNGGAVTLNGGNITTSGSLASGLQAAGTSSYSPNAQAQINATGIQVTTSGSLSDGITAGWSDGSMGLVNVTNSQVNTSGESSAGAAARYAGTINLFNTTIQATGDQSAAVYAEGGGVVSVNNSSLTSTKSDGVSLSNSATVTLNNSQVIANGASISSVLNLAGQTQNITVGAGSQLLQNNGTLLQVTRTDAGMDGIINLTLAPGSKASGDISDLNGLTNDFTRSGGGKTNFIVQDGARWIGMVRGINDIVVGGNSQFVNDGSAPINGNINSGQNASLIFNNNTFINGVLQLNSGSNASFNGNSTIVQNVIGNGSIISFLQDAILQHNLIGSSASQLIFNGNTNISNDVTGSGNSNFTFAGNTQIGGNLSGDLTNFTFSKTGNTHIVGNIDLTNSSTIHGGTQQNPIVIDGNALVSNGSILGGNLVVNGALSGSGGTVAPGNSVGTQTYASMAQFSGNYAAEVNAAGQSDNIIIQGNADLSGINLSVAQENGTGGYQLNHLYTILQTTNGGVVQNTFASTALNANLQNTLVKLDPVSYGTDAVQVSLSVDEQKLAAKQGDLTSNQKNTLSGIVGAAGQNSAVDAAMQSTNTANALDQLSGEIHASLRSSLFASSTMLTDTVMSRARPEHRGSQASNQVWVQTLGGKYSLDGNSNAAKSTNKNGGIAVGGALALDGGWQLGLALAYNNEDIDVDARSSSADVDTTTMMAYANNSWAAGAGNVNLVIGGGYSWHSIDTERNVNLVNQKLTASYDANTTQAFADIGYAIPVTTNFTVEPYTGMAWYRQSTDDFTEHNGNAALKGQGDDQDVTLYNLGLRNQLKFSVAHTPAAVNMSAGWRHAAGDVDSDVKLGLAQNATPTYTVTGAPITKDAAVVSIGIEAQVLNNAVVGTAYNGQLSDDNSDNAGSLYFKYTF
ncbi:autotransporter outer membrane beta-barrel domain-containing protein [Limnobaculum parvum]|nr:autotransporter domain-containing protein [Limnobaculum parvum]